MLIDGTLSGVVSVRETMKLHRIPYFNFDYSIQSAVKMLELYLTRRDAMDVVLIFEDDSAVVEAFYAFVGKSSMRTLFLHTNSKAIERLNSLRPAPSYFTLIGETAKMEGFYQTVRHNLPKARFSKKKTFFKSFQLKNDKNDLDNKSFTQ
jgi:hypothetical protein